MFYDRLKEVCKLNGITVSKMLKELNMSTSSTGSWKNGMLPKGEVLKAISLYLNVSVDFLLFGDRTFMPISEDERNLLDSFNKLSDINKGKIIERINVLIEESK